jgi:hypothetical protein
MVTGQNFGIKFELRNRENLKYPLTAWYQAVTTLFPKISQV